MSIATARFSVILWGFAQAMKVSARRHPAFRDRLRERNLVAQIKARDEETGRWFDIRAGKVRSGAGLHARPDITLAFKTAAIALRCSPRRSTGSTRSTPRRIST
jgi:hypothetical protein